ncbi:MAG TPA: flagellin, partial [Pseudomonas sp.]|nr:flagellin [Pseudomonas sp.]
LTTSAVQVLGEAKVTGSTNFDDPDANSSISLNGTSISVLKGDTVDDLMGRINSADLGITASKAGTKLVLASASKIAIDGSAAGLTAAGLEKGTTQVATGNAEGLFTTAAAAAADYKISFNGKEISVATGDTRQNIVDKINASGSGVTASLADAAGAKIKLASANEISITGEAAALTAFGAGDTGGAVKVKAAPVTTQFDGKTAKEASIRLNGEEMTIAAGSKIEDVAASINQNSDATKVTAEVKNGRLQLSSTDGAAIKLEDATAGSLAQLGLKAGTTEAKLLDEDTSISLNGTEIKLAKGADMDSIVTSINSASTGVTASKDPVDGSLTLFSDKSFSVADGKDGTGLEALGLTEGTTEASTEVKSISELDITSAAGAQEALQALDGALQQVDSMRAELGAVQNRFDSTISNLQNISENASAARGRITDTDYAAESANLAKNQIMQQAGTAMLAQANQLPQAVLSLLQ